MTTDKTDARDELARYVPWIAGAIAVTVAVPVGLTRGAPSVALWFAFVALASAVLLFWEALRTALDPAAPGDEDATDDEGAPAELEARKKAALQALRDIDFERSIGRLSDEDHAALEKKYRDEARAAMKAIDEGLGPWLKRADEMLARAEKGVVAKAEVKTEEKIEAKADAHACPKCETVNDADAVFCKKCGTRVAEEARDAT